MLQKPFVAPRQQAVLCTDYFAERRAFIRHRCCAVTVVRDTIPMGRIVLEEVHI